MKVQYLISLLFDLFEILQAVRTWKKKLEQAVELYKMAMSILPKFLTLKWNISRTIWSTEVGDGSFFAFFTLFHLSLTFFRPEVPFKSIRRKAITLNHVELRLKQQNTLQLTTIIKIAVYPTLEYHETLNRTVRYAEDSRE